MKNKLARKTITIPEDLYILANQIAAQTGKSFSSYVSDVVNKDLYGIKNSGKKELDDVMGVLPSVKLKKPLYNKRSDLYNDHIKRKMGNRL